jgi:uncharacterized membrane protein HdeD (DUF308 family)
MGVVSMMLGSLAIGASFVAVWETVPFLGCLFLGGGIVSLIESENSRGGAGFFGHVLATILYGVVGGYILTHPALGIVSLTLLVGMVFSVGGISQIIASLIMRYKSSGWVLLQGSISLLLALMLHRQWPVTGFWAMGAYVGIDLIFRGLATFMLALGIRAGVKPLTDRTERGFLDRRMKERRHAA